MRPGEPTAGLPPARECAPIRINWLFFFGVMLAPALLTALVELIFNALMLGTILLMRRRKILPGQHFHIYLIAYGIFRFLHEFLRATPEILGPVSGYQIASLGIVALGLFGFWRRKKEREHFGEFANI